MMFYVTWTLRKYLLARAALNKEISLEVIVSQHCINEVCLLCIDCAILPEFMCIIFTLNYETNRHKHTGRLIRIYTVYHFIKGFLAHQRVVKLTRHVESVVTLSWNFLSEQEYRLLVYIAKSGLRLQTLI